MKRTLVVLFALVSIAGLFASGGTGEKAAAATPIKNPDTFTYATHGEPETLDPSKVYDNASGGIIQNIYENLIYYDGGSTEKFKAVLATEIPTVANGGISKDGLTYTFKIRQGVKFHSGAALTAEVVRWSLIRGMITDPDGGPQWLLLSPLVGVGATRDGDGNIDVNFADIAKSITVSGNNVVFKLVDPHPAFLAVLAYCAFGIVDKDFAVKNGDWDGSEATWKTFNNPATGSEKLKSIASGTGPFKLDRWEAGTEIVMSRNDGYWGTKPAMAKAIYKVVEEWSTRKLMLLQGDADIVEVAPGDYAEMDKETGLTVYRDNPQLSVRAINFNQSIVELDNPFLGSGKLDGQGIPKEFFSDKNVRLGFAHAWDQATYMQDIAGGHVANAATPIVKGLPFFNDKFTAMRPAFDLKKAEDAFKKAWGGQVWEKGFKFDALYNTGNTTREQALKLLSENLAKVNPKFVMEVRGVEWATLLNAQRSRQLTIFYIGWGADYPDPDNFADPYMNSETGTYAKYSGYKNPEADKLILEGRVELDAAKRKVIYERLQQIWLDDVVGIALGQPIVNRYFKDWVKGYVYHAMENEYLFSMFSKK